MAKNTGIERTASTAPARFRKRTILWIAAITTALVGLSARVGLGFFADGRLKARVDAYRAAGEPILLEDFSIRLIPAEENAATELLTAAAACVDKLQSAAESGFSDDESDPGAARTSIKLLSANLHLVKARCAAVEHLLVLNEKAIRLTAEGCRKDRVNWHVRFTTPAINTPLPHLAGLRNLGRLMSVQAVHLHLNGDDEAALQAICNALTLARKVDVAPLGMINHLVAVAMNEYAVSAIESVCNELDGVSVARTAGRAAIESLIAQLLEEDSSREGLRAGLYGERAMILDASQCYFTGNAPVSMNSGSANSSTAGFGWLGFGLRPFWVMDTVDALEYVSSFIPNPTDESYSIAMSRTRSLAGRGDSKVDAVVHVISRVFAPSLDRCLLLCYRDSARRRMAAIALAIRLYELDHARLPSTLMDLVPEYLPEVPTDPFAADGRPVGYRPDLMRLYSVGSNGQDDGGGFGVKGRGEVDSDVADIPFFLGGTRAEQIAEQRRIDGEGDEETRSSEVGMGNGGQAHER